MFITSVKKFVFACSLVWAFAFTFVFIFAVKTALAAEIAQSPYEKHETSWVPAGPVTIIIPAAHGGNTDVAAQMFAKYAREKTGHDFEVIAMNGKAGSIASRKVLESAPDGLTVLFGHTLVNVANIAGVTDYNYTAFKLGPTFAKDPAQQLYVKKGKYANLADFIAHAKKDPGLLVGAVEFGAYTDFELQALQMLAGIELYLDNKGSNAQKTVAMLAGGIDIMPAAYVNAKYYLETGDFDCIGAPTTERYELIKDIPTLKEQGIDLVYPDCDFSFYFPKSTPDEVIFYFENLVQNILSAPVVQDDMTVNAFMMPYYLNAQDSAKNEAAMFDVIKSIADSVKAAQEAREAE